MVYKHKCINLLVPGVGQTAAHWHWGEPVSPFWGVQYHCYLK